MSIDAENSSPARFGRRLLVLTIALLAVACVRFAARHHSHNDNFPDEGSQPYGD